MNNLTQPAYPVVPLQDNFKRLIVPVPGLSKLEYFALEIYKTYLIKDNMVTGPIKRKSIMAAIDFLNQIEEISKTLNNDKSNEMAIFDR